MDLQKFPPTFNGNLYLIPPPKLDYRERERRRLAYRNERNLYKRKSSLSGQDMISFFHADSPFKVYSNDEWWSDSWDAISYGRDFNFNKSFFEQFYELQLAVPRPPLVNNKADNSPYCNFADENKNCHLITSANRCENCYYGFLLVQCESCVDCLWCTDSRFLYQCIDCRNCYELKYGQNCENCSQSAYLYGCKRCQNCISCTNLIGKNYHIFNKPVTKEEYERAYRVRSEMLESSFKRFANITGSENVCGNNIFNSWNIFMGFDVYNSEDCSYLHDGLGAKNCADICFFDGVELCYESTSLIGYGYRFTNFCRGSSDLFYCDNCHGCNSLFGCDGLRGKSYYGSCDFFFE